MLREKLGGQLIPQPTFLEMGAHTLRVDAIDFFSDHI